MASPPSVSSLLSNGMGHMPYLLCGSVSVWNMQCWAVYIFNTCASRASWEQCRRKICKKSPSTTSSEATIHRITDRFRRSGPLADKNKIRRLKHSAQIRNSQSNETSKITPWNNSFLWIRGGQNVSRTPHWWVLREFFLIIFGKFTFTRGWLNGVLKVPLNK